MKFTLSLTDYLEQYITNMDTGSKHCPVCYEQVLEHNKHKDIEHILECYKLQLLELHIMDTLKKTGDVPPLTDELIDNLDYQVSREINNYYRLKTQHL